MTNLELNRAFVYLNKHYFDEKLNHPIELKFGVPKDNRCDGETKFTLMGTTVLIHEGLRSFGNMAIIALLHEMAHISRQDIRHPDGHGMQYWNEIIRLFNIGAYEGLL